MVWNGWTSWCPFRFDSQIVVLNKNDENGSVIEKINEYGAYEFVVESTYDKHNGSVACFTVASNAFGGSVNRSVATAGKFGEHVTLSWSKGTVHPRLKYSQTPNNDGPTEQSFRVVWKKIG